MTRQRLAIFTPVPPQPSGIAAYNAELLVPALAVLADVVVVCEDAFAHDAATQFSVPVLGYGSYRASSESRGRFPVYHMGNHPHLHGWIHDALLEEPGLVVLHDPSLLDFYVVRDSPGARFSEELRHNYGDAYLDFPPPDRGFEGRPRLRLDRRVAEAARTLIVHSPWAQREIARRHPIAQVAYVPLAAQVHRSGADELDLRDHLGWTEDEVVFGLPAAFAWHKRADLAATVFAAVHRSHPRTRLLVTGRMDSPEAADRFHAALTGTGAEDAVVTLADAPGAEFEAALHACDVVIDLRWPTAGEVPATLVRSFGAGKPAVVSDRPQLRHLDKDFCWRVPADPLECAPAAVRRLSAIATDPSMARRAGERARSCMERSATPEIVARRYLELVEVLAGTPDPIRRARPAALPVMAEPIGVNVIGDLRATTGLMEAGRRTLSALVGAGAAVEVTPFQSAADQSPTRGSPEIDRLPVGRPHDIDVWLLNLNEFFLIPDEELRPDDRPRYTIAPWFWELGLVPDEFAAQAPRLDEIWAASRFVRDVLVAAVPVGTPVVVVPCLVDVPMPPVVERSDFGIPDDAVVYFFNFDAWSSAARKNPWGVIDAFGSAFSPEERNGPARLVIKVHNLHHTPDLEAPLREAVAAVNGILIDAEITREQMNALLASIDVYVSLHRSEGFGLGIAESMFLGKPTVVTAYSGNMDFTHAANSCLVGYEFRPITEMDHVHFPAATAVYKPGLLWADPSVPQAAAWMRRLYEQPDLRRVLGRAAAATIRDRYSRANVQRAVIGRLQAVRQALDAAQVPAPAG
jgi:glycosyltransferase involved in cell wall biosynthesis